MDLHNDLKKETFEIESDLSLTHWLKNTYLTTSEIGDYPDVKLCAETLKTMSFASGENYITSFNMASCSMTSQVLNFIVIVHIM